MFQIDDDVNLFYINESGQVTTPYPPSSLHLYKFRDPAMMDTPAMLQVGSWVYPLVPGKSPVLQSSAGSYMFPDLDDSLSGIIVMYRKGRRIHTSNGTISFSIQSHIPVSAN